MADELLVVARVKLPVLLSAEELLVTAMMKVSMAAKKKYIVCDSTVLYNACLWMITGDDVDDDVKSAAAATDDG